MTKNIILFCILSISSITGFAAQLDISDAWIREAPPTAKNLAGYVTLSNKSKKTIEINSAKSTLFAHVQMHVTSFEKGMMHMEKLKHVKIAPGEKVIFMPGGRHFMLMKPTKVIKTNMDVPVELKFSDGTAQTIHFKVQKEKPLITGKPEKTKH